MALHPFPPFPDPTLPYPDLPYTDPTQPYPTQGKPLPEGVDPSKREVYLSDPDFLKVTIPPPNPQLNDLNRVG